MEFYRKLNGRSWDKSDPSMQEKIPVFDIPVYIKPAFHRYYKQLAEFRNLFS